MGKLSAAELLQDDFKVANVRFISESGSSVKQYTYKVDFACKEGDYILVPVAVSCNPKDGKTEFNRLAVVVVEQIGSKGLLVSSQSNFHNWAIGLVSSWALAKWTAQTLRDAMVQEEYNQIIEAQKMAKLRDQVFSELSGDELQVLSTLANAKIKVAAHG